MNRLQEGEKEMKIYRMKDGLDNNVVDELGCMVNENTMWSMEDIEADAENFGMAPEEFINRYLKEYDNDVITTCTAIAACDNENENCRQDALLVTSVTESGEHTEYVVFGWDMPESGTDYTDMCNDPNAWEALCDEHHVKEA